MVANCVGYDGKLKHSEQAWTLVGCKVFVLPSSSAANRGTGHLEGRPSRLAWWREFADVLNAS